MFKTRFVSLVVFLVFCIGTTHVAYSKFSTGRIGGARNLINTPVVDLIDQLNSKLSLTQQQINNILSDASLWLTNSDIENLNLDLDVFGGYPLDQHELAYLTHSLAVAFSDNSSNLADSQQSLQNLINSSSVTGTCNSNNCSETSADWVHGQVSDDSFSTTSLVNMITTSLLDDLMSGDSAHVDGYTSLVLGANSAVGIQDLQNDAYFQSISNPNGNQPPPATEIRNAINYIAGFVQPETVGAPTPTEYTAGQTLVDNFLNNSDRGNFTLANFISCYNNNEAARSGGQGTCTVTASAWDQQLIALANFNSAKSTLAGGTALSLADLQAIPVTFGNNLTTPIQEWHADYISSQLGTGDTVSLTDWQNTINGIDEGVAARWKIEQVANGVAGHPANDVTNHLLARATDGTFDAATALGAGASKTAAGFGGSTNISGLTSTSTPAQIQSAVLAYIGFTEPMYTAWNANSDRANFSLADFTACFNNNEVARSGGAGTCNITSAQWASNSSQLTYFAEAKTLLGTAGTVLTDAQLSNIGLNLPSSPSPLPLYARTYLSAQLSTRDNATNTSEWQEVLDYYNDQTASRWFIGAAASATGSSKSISVGMPPSGTAQTVTIADIPTTSLGSAVLTVAGMGSSAISDSGTTIASLQNNIRSSGLTSTSTGTNIDDWIVSTAGFGSTVTYADLQTAITNGWTSANYNLASNQSGWTNSSADASAYSLCLSSSDSFTGGANTCSITASAWNTTTTGFSSAKSQLSTAGSVLTEAQLDAIGLNLPSSPSPLPSYSLTYLSAQLSLRNAATNISEWQEVIDYYNDQTAARWYVGNAAASTGSNRASSVGMPPNGLASVVTVADIPTTSLTTAILTAAGMGANTMSQTGATLSDLQGGIRSSGLTSTSTGTNIDDWIVSTAGFGSTVTYADLQTAITNGWTSANYNLASNQSGWTNASADSNAFTSCQSSTNSSTGGSGTCTMSKSNWSTIQVAENVMGGGSLTASDVSSILSLGSVTASADLNTSNAVHLDYLESCVTNSANAVSQIQTCAQNATTAGLSRFEVGGIADGTYGTNSLTATLLTSAGAMSGSNNQTMLNGNYCGNSGNASCINVLRSAITTSSLSGSSSSSNIDTWIKSTLRTGHEAWATSTTASNPAAQNACSSSNFVVPGPGLCDHPAFVCSIQNSTIVSLDDGNGNGWNERVTVTPPATQTSASTETYTIRAALSHYPSWTTDYNYTFTLNASTSGTQAAGSSWHTISSAWNVLEACEQCPSGYRLATKTEAQAAGYSPDGGWWTSSVATQADINKGRKRVNGSWQADDWPRACKLPNGQDLYNNRSSYTMWGKSSNGGSPSAQQGCWSGKMNHSRTDVFSLDCWEDYYIGSDPISSTLPAFTFEQYNICVRGPNPSSPTGSCLGSANGRTRSYTSTSLRADLYDAPTFNKTTNYTHMTNPVYQKYGQGIRLHVSGGTQASYVCVNYEPVC